MSEALHLTQGISRAERYRELLPQIEAVISGEPDLIANLANISAMLKEGLGFFWVGFYRTIKGELVLGPFQGPLACTRIAFGKGVCGTAALQQSSIQVPDVDAFPGHIACSSLSKSEVVIPLISSGETVLILDVDSDTINDFSDTDISALEQIMEMVKRQHFAA